MDRRFDYHKPDAEKVELLIELRAELKMTAQFLEDLLPESREKALAITKLEESLFWANASIAREK